MTQKFKTYAITVRPKDGVSDKHINVMAKWVRKHCEYYHIVTEKEGSQRHIHVAVVLHEAKPRSNIVTMMKCVFKDFDDTERKVLFRGIKILYNEDFIYNYLDKDDDTVVIDSHLPEKGFLESYFPPKPVESDGRTKKCSLFYHELESLWYQHTRPGEDVNTVNARNFLFKMMYSDRLIPVIRDDKGIIQTARHLTRWLNKSDYSTVELPPFEKEE